MSAARHQLAGALADIGYARMAFQAGDREECLLTLQAISRELAAFKPATKADSFHHRKAAALLDGMIERYAANH